MADPTPYDPDYSFSGFQASNPSKPLPAPQLDNELANVSQSVNEAINAIKDTRRSDGALKNGIVTPDSLSDATRDEFMRLATGVEKADEATAIIGEDNEEYMTPLTTDQAIRNRLRYLTPQMFTDLWDDAPGADNTIAIQAALDAAHEDRIMGVHFPAGFYEATTLKFYTGNNITGEYQASFGLGSDYGADYVGSVLKQRSGTLAHFITFDPLDSGDGFDRAGPFRMDGMILLGNGEAGGGDGLRFQERSQSGALDNNSATRKMILQSLTLISNMMIRNFAGNGMWLPACHGGVQVQNLNSFFNGGYGVLLDLSFGTAEALHFLNCDGDGNLLGNFGIYKMGSATTSARNGANVTFTSPRGEQRVNPNAFAAGAIGSKNLIVLDGCNGGAVNVIGAGHQSSVADDKPGDTILIKNQTTGWSPKVTIVGPNVTINPLIGQDVSADTSVLLSDTVNSKTIPHGVSTAIYGVSPYSAMVPAIGKPWSVVGMSAPMTVSVPSGGMQIGGNSPAYMLWETDAATDMKGWGWVASGDGLSLRAFTDAGVADIGLNITRTLGAITLFDFSKGAQFLHSFMRMSALPVFADNAAAVAGGLVQGRLYRTATGEVRVVVS